MDQARIIMPLSSNGEHERVIRGIAGGRALDEIVAIVRAVHHGTIALVRARQMQAAHAAAREFRRYDGELRRH